MTPHKRASDAIRASSEIGGQVALDRHCQQGLQEGYTIADDLPFCRFLDHHTGDEREYRERGRETKTVCHWGQRKLLISEIEFLTRYYDQAKVVVYAGAAPGVHLLCLAQLFPKLKLVLVDPRPFSSDVEKAARDPCFGGPGPRATIELRRSFFTDDTAREFAGQTGLLFISDVRGSVDEADQTATSLGVAGPGAAQMATHTAALPSRVMTAAPTTADSAQALTSPQPLSGCPLSSSAADASTTKPSTTVGAPTECSARVAYPSQCNVESDMGQQSSWHLLLNPLASSFKFRLPWNDGTTSYLKGDISLPVWGPATTTECRLFVERPPVVDTQTPPSAMYDNRKYERQMFYFNTHRRIAKYHHDYMDYYRCACFDCSSEAVVLAAYLTAARRQPSEERPPAAEEDVPSLSRRLDMACHRDRQRPRTLFDPNPDPEERKQRILKRQKRR
eukprot:TRINITY_DN68341_c0_g1_i1.p1 TRINITY_DN68341_c0_g1~~TRINITY_DN68341_c0_g1_i1.p1  ORF type:complete len:448 (-),score=67.16 TRINITY_DN68341_c0_g1_i1:100-1443(-)